MSRTLELVRFPANVDEKDGVRAVVSAIPEGAALLNAAGETVATNDLLEELLRNTEPLAGKSVEALFGEEQGGPLSSVARQALATGLPAQGSGVIERRAGGAVVIDVRVGLLPERRGALLIARDLANEATEIAALQRLEIELLRAQRSASVGQLAGGIIHDFNNVLSVILNYAGFLAEELGERDPSWADVEEIRRSAQRAAGLTRQLLTFSRIDVARPTPVSLTKVVRDLEQLFSRTLGEGIRFATHLEIDLPPVLADLVQLEQVVTNLVLNARDAMPDGGELTVETRSVIHGGRDDPGSWAVLVVSDTGMGMTDDVAQRIFEPFYTTKARGRGTGLGLSTVRTIVDQHGGHIDVQTSPGRGTAFRVFLPITDQDYHGEALPPQPVPRQGRDEVVLVVEDEEPVRAMMARILARYGYRVLDAASAKEAIALAARAPRLDLIVTDVVLPESSGVELVKVIQALGRAVAVLYVSGYLNDDVVARIGREERLLQKPFTRFALLDAVQAALERERRAASA